MQRSIGSWILTLAGALALVATQAGAVSSTFDTDLDGWTPVGLDIGYTAFPPAITTFDLVDNAADMVHESSGGNPGGYARLTDAIEEPASFASAPGKFLGDLSGFVDGTFSFDHKLFDPGASAAEIAPYSLFISAGVEGDPMSYLNTLVWTAPAPLGATDWVHFDIGINETDLTLLENVSLQVLDPSLLDITPASVGLFGTMTFDEILANVSTILVGFEIVNNSVQNEEWGGIDNVSLAAVPEPTTATLLALGLVVLARRGRKH